MIDPAHTRRLMGAIDRIDLWARNLPGRVWRWLRGRTPGQWGVAGLAVSLVAAGMLDYATRPPPIPGYATVRANYRPSEAWLYDRHGRLIDSMRVDFAKRRLAWTPLTEIAPEVPAAIVAAEDKRFRDHAGVDWLALAGTMRDRIRGARGRGASTISMQLAGYLSPELAAPGRRGPWEKLRQLRAARALEAGWSKDRIIEAYLNLAGFRGETQGIGAAALALFRKTPAALTGADAALLAALLPNPQATPETVARRACRRAGGDCEGFRAAAASALGPARSLALDPGLAPHLSARLLTRAGMRVTTTLDAATQRLAVTAVRRQLAKLGPARVRDAAAVVLDNRTGDVLAYVGGVGGSSTASAVDGAAAYRQAGSTLKPFLYAQAFERGYLTPASILEDSPVQLDTATGLYVPQNYDRAFKGQVTARTALAGSLNVPAVRALLLVGPEPFRDRLWDSGYRGMTEDGQFYGFSLALGSAEVTLLEQAAAYRSLALGGRWSPPRLALTAPAPAPVRVTTAEAAFLASDIIADAGARAVTFGVDSALRLPFWAAVKTGTSKGMRDNWCVGFTDRFTVAVWVGNLEGDPMTGVSGTSGAAPIWRDIMLALGPGKPMSPPAGVESRQVRFAVADAGSRREYFLRGTAQAEIAAVPETARRPRIVSPVAGSVYALDPDIPPDRQRLAVGVTGPAATLRLVLDARDLGPADGKPALLAGPGVHVLKLVDLSGRTVDQVRFTVR